MKKLFTIVLILVSCALVRAQDTSFDSLGVMSYNVGAFRKWEKNSIPRVASIISESGASFVALQEVDKKVGRSGYVHQPKKLAETLSAGGERWEWAFGKAIKILSGSYGNAIVWKDVKGLTTTHRIAIPKGEGREKRCCLIVETPQCVFASVHLDYAAESAAMEGIRLVTEYMTSRYSRSDKPVFLCGDFNVEPGSPIIAYALESWTLLSDVSQFTFPCKATREASKTIDYVFLLSNKFSCGQASSKVIYGDRLASDHYPVLVRVPLN